MPIASLKMALSAIEAIAQESNAIKQSLYREQKLPPNTPATSVWPKTRQEELGHRKLIVFCSLQRNLT